MNHLQVFFLYIALPLFALVAAHLLLTHQRRADRAEERETAYAHGYQEACTIAQSVLQTHAGPTPQAALLLAELEAAAPDPPEAHHEPHR